MPAPKQTKKQRIDEAREAARIAREKREARQKRMRVLIPSLISVGVLAIVALIVVVIVVQPKPAPTFPGGPKNMASDGILFQADNGKAAPVATSALKKGEKPKANTWSKTDGIAHIVTYIDWTCPICQKFEDTYATQLTKLVDSGAATLEVHPIAILDANFTGDKYSTRSANVAACVANYAPDSYLKVQTAAYKNQAAERSAGLSDDQLLKFVHSAGLQNAKVDACIRGGSFEKWVSAATQRAVNDKSLQGTQGFGTPTVMVNGQKWDGSTDLAQFIQSATTGSSTN